jgi:hypothetical protein
MIILNCISYTVTNLMMITLEKLVRMLKDAVMACFRELCLHLPGGEGTRIVNYLRQEGLASSWPRTELRISDV